MHRSLLILLGLGGLSLALTTPAEAHTSIAGVGLFPNGLLHPVAVPQHLLLLIGLGLWMGRQIDQRVPACLAALNIGLVIGYIATVWLDLSSVSGIALAFLTLVFGSLLAVGRSIPIPIGLILMALAGLALGLDSKPEALTANETMLLGFGIWIGVNIIAVNVMALSAKLQHPIAVIGIRVVGSWLIAISLILMAFALRS
ncbi:MAG: HupE/UreJ family protein [Alphaproteobacteria bacterium]|nr:HupE/UreJ family protein [Alphaproteobacteria bacterium]